MTRSEATRKGHLRVGMDEATGAFYNAVTADDKGTIQQRILFYGFIDEGIEQIAFFGIVAMERIQYQRMNVRFQFFDVAQDKQATDRFAFSTFDRQFGGNGQQTLENFRQNIVGQNIVLLREDRLYFPLYIDDHKRIQAIASREAAQTAYFLIVADVLVD